ncbi:MAG: hypothetical protein IKC15_04380 [Kiritimatiellae bacterium]|nr:hypothetical protein [Kiritimatiellia bacterium]
MKNYDFCFGCGFSCGVTQALRAANLQFASLPFDWTATPSFPKAARMAASDFAHWLDREDLELIDVRHSGINRRVYFNRRTGFGFVHDFSLFKSPDDAYAEVKAKYERRAERFRECLESARTALAVCVEWPLLGRLRDETLAETKRVFETRFPGVKFDLLYFHVAEGAGAAVVESERDGITVVGCEYRKFLEDGVLHHEIDNSQILAFLKANFSAPDPRSEEEKRRYDEDWRRQDRARWHGRNAFETMVNRSAFRLYRKLERFLARKGLAPQERPMWFGTENEPR